MCKKLICLIWFVLLVGLILTNAANAQDTSLAQDPDLIGWWTFNEGSGTTANDRSGSGNDATINGEAEFVDGYFGTALLCNGTDVYAGVGNVVSNLTEFTVCGWVAVSNFNAGRIGIFGANDNFEVIFDNGQLGILTYSNSFVWVGVDWTYSYPSWHHIAMVGYQDNFIVYVDGVEVASANNNRDGYGAEANSFNIGGGGIPDPAGNWLDGMIDDVYLFTRPLSQDELLLVMQGLHEKPAALNPNPTDGETDVARDATLSWTPGHYAETHNVFFGTNADDVNNATTTDSLGVTVTEGLNVNSFDPGNLEYGTTYFWRVDEINAPSSPGEFKGQVWSFTAETYLNKILAENITVTAISSDVDSDPYNTINESGLDADDLHSNDTEDMWLSSGADTNDVWIQYDFDKPYYLHQMYVWNFNGGFWYWYAGFNEVTIEYSADGENFEVLDGVSTFAIGTGSVGYAHNTTIDFNGLRVMSVRITSHSNHGVWPNHGLSEVRFIYKPVSARKPEPAVGATDVSVNVDLKWRAGREASEHDVYIDTDQQAVTDGTVDFDTVSQTSYSTSLELGRTYFWRVDEVNDAEDPAVWEGNIWSFSTREYLLIEGFEDYNNYDENSDEAIWWTWFDGYQINDNGALITHNLPPFCEPDIVQDGKWSAPLYYDNTGTADNSEVERIFDNNQNLTVNGADTLRLFYRGRAITTFAQAPDGTIAMSGGGADIAGGSDEFRFAYKQLTGNGSIIARVDSIENTNPLAKAGVMIRNNLDPNSAHGMVILTPGDLVSFQRRTAQDSTAVGTDSQKLTCPYWVKLTRSSNTLTAERSEDGINWVSVGKDLNTSKAQISLGNSVYIGFAVTSHNADELAAATFSNVEITGNVSGNWQVVNIGDEEMLEGENSLDELYVALEDSNGNRYEVYAPGNAVGSGEWTAFEIPYTDFDGVNMSRIKKIAVGVGDASNSTSGAGLVYIDSIGYGHSLD